MNYWLQIFCFCGKNDVLYCGSHTNKQLTVIHSPVGNTVRKILTLNDVRNDTDMRSNNVKALIKNIFILSLASQKYIVKEKVLCV